MSPSSKKENPKKEKKQRIRKTESFQQNLSVEDDDDFICSCTIKTTTKKVGKKTQLLTQKKVRRAKTKSPRTKPTEKEKQPTRPKIMTAMMNLPSNLARVVRKDVALCPSSVIHDILVLINKERRKQGLKTLQKSRELCIAAQKHANDMAKRNYFSHKSPEETTPKMRITDAGFVGKAFGENLASGQKTPEEVVASWMDSSGHKANILSRQFSHMGIGRVKPKNEDGYYWVQTFGSL